MTVGGTLLFFFLLRTRELGGCTRIGFPLIVTYLYKLCQPTICGDVVMFTRAFPTRLLKLTAIASQRSLPSIHRSTFISISKAISVKKANMATFRVPKVENEPNV